MFKSLKPWRALFALAVIGIAILQIKFLVFMPVILPWPADLAASHLGAWVGSIIIIGFCVPILLGFKAKPAAIYLGSLFLLALLVFHIPYQFLTNPAFLGGWANPLKISALAGCAYIVALSLPQAGTFTTGFEKLLPVGKYLFALTMVVFGIEHFVYASFVQALVPRWIPFHLFWTYFAGVALIAAGVGIILNIKRSLAATLLGIMLLIWAVILHFPRAWADPKGLHGNEVVSLFEALAFAAAAFILAALSKKR